MLILGFLWQWEPCIFKFYTRILDQDLRLTKTNVNIGAMLRLLVHVFCHAQMGDMGLSPCVTFPFLPSLNLTLSLFYTVTLNKNYKTPRKHWKLTKSFLKS